MSEPKTLIEAVRHFSDLDVCHAYMVALKWPDGAIRCPSCGCDKIGLIQSRRLLQCKNVECRRQLSAKVGTIFEDSPIGLDKWFVAVWVIANCKNGVSSCELARAIGVQQKSAWFMLHRIRAAMETNSFRKLNGEVESDETYVGGKAVNMHAERREEVIQGRGAVGKTIVQGLLERGIGDDVSTVRAVVVSDTEAGTLVGNVALNVAPESHVYTDALSSYTNLAPRWFHDWVDHVSHFVRGRVHVNGLENFWCLLKRALKGTYTHCAPFHLQRYLDEEVFRFNERDHGDGERFALVMRGVLGKRLTYRQLCMVDGCGFMGLE